MLSLSFILILAGLIYCLFIYLEAKIEEVDEVMNNKAFGVAVLIMKDNKVLSVARRDDPNMWGLPGGRVESNETEEEAAIRECLEETGLLIWNLQEVNRRSTGFDIAVTFTADYEGEPVTQPGEPECKWQDPEALMTGVFGQYNTDLFRKFGIR